MLTISLLHATYQSPTGPRRHRDTWLSHAASPDRVEYVVAMDDADLRAQMDTKGMIRAINHPPDTFSTAVQNWNSAAKLAGGSLLFVISDDLLPSQGWDNQLTALVGERDPINDDFAIKVQDSPNQSDTTLRHPVVSRQFFERFGLFDDSFRGVFCDNDITLRALLYSEIIDGRSVLFTHEHPHFDSALSESVSQQKINRSEEYEFGRRTFMTKYSPFHIGLGLNELTLPTAKRRSGLLPGVRRAGIKLKGTFTRVPDSVARAAKH